MDSLGSFSRQKSSHHTLRLFVKTTNILTFTFYQRTFIHLFSYIKLNQHRKMKLIVRRISKTNPITFSDKSSVKSCNQRYLYSSGFPTAKLH